MSSSLVTEVIAVWRGNSFDDLDTAEVFLFSDEAITAKHDLYGPAALQEIRQHLRREI